MYLGKVSSWMGCDVIVSHALWIGCGTVCPPLAMLPHPVGVSRQTVQELHIT
jgi:hypothetical protein